MAIAIMMMRGGKKLARLDEHFADMLVAVVPGCDGGYLVQIEDIHTYLSKINNVGLEDLVQQML